MQQHTHHPGIVHQDNLVDLSMDKHYQQQHKRLLYISQVCQGYKFQGLGKSLWNSRKNHRGNCKVYEEDMWTTHRTRKPQVSRHTFDLRKGQECLTDKSVLLDIQPLSTHKYHLGNDKAGLNLSRSWVVDTKRNQRRKNDQDTKLVLPVGR